MTDPQVVVAAVVSSVVRWSLALALLCTVSGCARVRPWQRARLAAPVMTVPLAESPMVSSYRAKLLESKTGGGVPGTPAGGGCGCTH